MKFEGEIHSTKKIGFRNNSHQINETGLQKAYKSDNQVHVDGDTMFIAGTMNKQDLIDDFTKIPFYGDVRQSKRYTDVMKTLKKTQTLRK